MRQIATTEDGNLLIEMTRYEYQAIQKLDGWKFSIGQWCTLTGLIDHPEHNGKVVVITGYRPVQASGYCPSGRAYYTNFTEVGDFYYEERLEAL